MATLDHRGAHRRTRTQRVLNQVQRPDAYREVLIESAGTTVALSVWDGEPGAPAVLFLPGTMTHPLFYEEFLDALNRAGLSVVGLHPAGHGKSPRLRRPHELSFRMLVDNPVDALEWMSRIHPETPLLVIGSSQGGVLAIAVAASSELPSAVYAHNVLDPALPSSTTVTRAPSWLAPAYPQLRTALGLLGKVAPGIRVPFAAYLEMRRVSGDPAVKEFFYTDPSACAATRSACSPACSAPTCPGRRAVPSWSSRVRRPALQPRLHPSGVRPDRGPLQGARGRRG